MVRVQPGEPPSAARVIDPGRDVLFGVLLAPAHREHLERCCERDAESLPGLARHPLQELAGVEVLPAQALDVRRVRLQGRDPGVERIGGVDRVGRLRRPERPHGRHPAPRLEPVGELVVEDPTVAGVADGVEDGAADRDVVGLVEVAAAPGVAEVAGDDDVGLERAYLARDRRAQRDAVLDDAVDEPEELTTGTPTTSADAICSASRTRRHSSGSSPSMPASPLVTMQ